MKAIVNVSKGSKFSIFNGLTYSVHEILSNAIALNIDGRTVDFSHTEVIIVDITDVVSLYTELAKSARMVGGKDSPLDALHNIRKYIKANKIESPKPSIDSF